VQHALDILKDDNLWSEWEKRGTKGFMNRRVTDSTIKLLTQDGKRLEYVKSLSLVMGYANKPYNIPYRYDPDFDTGNETNMHTANLFPQYMYVTNRFFVNPRTSIAQNADYQTKAVYHEFGRWFLNLYGDSIETPQGQYDSVIRYFNNPLHALNK
jgi:hypothetical protein